MEPRRKLSNYTDSALTSVASLIDKQDKSWNLPIVREMCEGETMLEILFILLSFNGKKDKLVCLNARDGRYTVKEEYKAIGTKMSEEESFRPSTSRSIKKTQ